MRQKSGPEKAPAEQIVKDIRRATRRQFSAEEKIRIVLEGVRGEESIAELCRLEGIASSMYYGWSKEFLDAGCPSSDNLRPVSYIGSGGSGSSEFEAMRPAGDAASVFAG